MDVPETSTHNTVDAAARRSKVAVASGAVVDIADVAVRLDAADAPHRAVMENLLGGLAPATRSPDVSVRLTRGRPPMPNRPADEEEQVIQVWYTDDQIAVDCSAGLSAVADGTTADIGGSPPPSKLSWAFRTVFQLVVTHMLALHDRFVLHGGAVAKGDTAIVVLGQTGKGKSTTILAALQAGWEALSDDLVVVRSDTQSSLSGCGIPRPLAIPPDVSGAHGGTGAAMAGDRRGRVELAPDCLSPGWRSVTGIIAVEHGRDPDGALVTLDGATAFRLVLDSWTASANPRLLPAFMPCAGILGRLPTWRLEHAPDPDRRLVSAGRHLDTALLAIAGDRSSRPGPC